MSHDDFDFEPIRGIPAVLPEGERLLWQGSPAWKSFALRAYHVRTVALYFLLLAGCRVAVGLVGSGRPADVLVSCVLLLIAGAVAIGLLSLLAYCSARSTVYTLTNRRVLLRHGVAVPMTLNIPLRLIDGAALKSFEDDTGDIALNLATGERIGYLITWPHLRPGRITRPQPSLRALAQPALAAELLSAALDAAAGTVPDTGLDAAPGAGGVQPVAWPAAGALRPTAGVRGASPTTAAAA